MRSGGHGAGSCGGKADTRIVVLEAAKKVLRQKRYAKLSTRDVAVVAGVPLSQIHCQFSSKQGTVLALFEHLNSQLLDHQKCSLASAALIIQQPSHRDRYNLNDPIN